MKQKYPYYEAILFVTIGFIALAGIGIFVWQQRSAEPAPPESPEQTYCTMEAKLCPDGSYVGRSGPNCEFAACPSVSSNEGWLTKEDKEQGISYQYPADLSTTYLHPQDWPPTVVLEAGIFSCAVEGKTLNNRTYCTKIDSEGAAGSVYTTYTYTRNLETENKMATVRFTIRSVQCGNYDEPEKSACEKERAEFNVDELADKISASIQPLKK